MMLGTEVSPLQPGQGMAGDASPLETVTLAGELLAPVGDRAPQPSLDEHLLLTEAQLETFGNMCFQLQRRLITRPTWVEDRVAGRQDIVQDVGEELAPEHSLDGYSTMHFGGGPSEEGVYTLASCVLAGASQVEEEAETILIRRTFFGELFSDQEKRTLLRLVTAVNDPCLPVEAGVAYPEAAVDALLVTAIEQAQRVGASTLFLLALQAFRIGATIEDPELGDKNLETFLNSLKALQPAVSQTV